MEKEKSNIPVGDREKFVSSYVSRYRGPKSSYLSSYDYGHLVSKMQLEKISVVRSVKNDRDEWEMKEFVKGINLVSAVKEVGSKDSHELRSSWENKTLGKVNPITGKREGKTWGNKSKKKMVSYCTIGSGGVQNRELNSRPSLICGKCYWVVEVDEKIEIGYQIEREWELIKKELDSQCVSLVMARWRDRDKGDFLYLIVETTMGTVLITRRSLERESLSAVQADTRIETI